MTRIGILGYGNLGRGVELAIRQNDDMELAAVYTRRDPASVSIATEGVPVRSVADLETGNEDIDVLMAGPHLAYIMDEVDELAEENPNLKVILMRKDYYSKLDGEAALDHMLEELGEA